MVKSSDRRVSNITLISEIWGFEAFSKTFFQVEEMSLLITSFRIVIVLCLLKSFCHKAAANRDQGSKFEIVLKKRDIESSSTDVDEWIRDSPESTGRSHDDLDATLAAYSTTASSKRDSGSGARNIDDHDAQKATLDFQKNDIPSARTFIQEKLAAHHEKIAAMRTERQKISNLLVFLEDHKEWLRNWGQVASGKTIEGILEDLRTYHKYVLQLIQDRLRGWGGLEGIVIGGKDSRKDAEEIEKDKGSIPTKKLRFENKQEEGNSLDPREISRNLHISQIVGHSSLYTVLRENITAQREASMELSQTQNYPSPTQDFEELRLLHFDLIPEKLKDDSVLELNLLLHSITFVPAEFELDDTPRSSRRAIKSCFQTFVFQELQFMYKFGLISENNLRQFFGNEKTQIITGIHLTDLFGVYWYGFFDYDHFMPDMKFILSHWHTEHLHISLQILNEYQQALVLYTALQETVKAYYDMEEWIQIRLERSHKFFIEKSFLSELKNCKKSDMAESSSSQSVGINPQLRENFEKLVNYFQSPAPDINIQDGEFDVIMKRIDYLLTYYILSFMKAYHPEILSQFFVPPVEYSTFKTQIELFQLGLEIHQNLNISMDFANSEPPEYINMKIVPDKVKEFEQGMMKEELKIISNNYMKLWNEASTQSTVDPKVKNWLEGLTVSEDIITPMTQKVQALINSDFTHGTLNHGYKNIWMIHR